MILLLLFFVLLIFNEVGIYKQLNLIAWFDYICRLSGEEFQWLMQREDYWQMLSKILIISILCYFLIGDLIVEYFEGCFFVLTSMTFAIINSELLSCITVVYPCMILIMSTTIWCTQIWASLTGIVFLCDVVLFSLYLSILKFCLHGWWNIHLSHGCEEIAFPYGCTLHSLFSFEDPGPHGNGRYSEHMLPEVEIKDFRKGAQVYFHGYYVEFMNLFFSAC